MRVSLVLQSATCNCVCRAEGIKVVICVYRVLHSSEGAKGTCTAAWKLPSAIATSPGSPSWSGTSPPAFVASANELIAAQEGHFASEEKKTAFYAAQTDKMRQGHLLLTNGKATR